MGGAMRMGALIRPLRILALVAALQAFLPIAIVALDEAGSSEPSGTAGHGTDAGDEAASETTAHGADAASGHHGGSRLSDEPIPLQLEGFPQRPRPFIDWGNNFLGTGTLWPGFELPTGAWWQPALLGFGSWRQAVQTFDDDRGERRTEYRTRLDLFFNLQLTGSERLVVGFRPLDQDGQFTRYVFEGPDEDDGFVDELDASLESLYFEGDFGEIFPDLSRDDFKRTDIGFSVGRQPLLFQEGQLIADAIDSLGLTRNTLMPKNTSNFRSTLLYAWNQVHRNGVEDEDAQLLGLLTSTDVRWSTIDVDVVYVGSDSVLGDQISAGASFTQRIGLTNTTFRLLGTFGLDDGPGAVGDGGLFFTELSWTPHHSVDLLYLNGFVAIDEYVPAARGPGIGGPLANAGIGFAGSGLGFPGPLSSAAADVGGLAIGYQRFGSNIRRQIIFELGGRIGLEDEIQDEIAGTIRWQMAMRQHYVLLIDVFTGWREGLADSDSQTLSGGRVELVIKF